MPSSSSGSGSWGTYFLGPYRVVDEIGVGGMATVELARMDGAGGFQKWVAIKRIHPHLTEDQQFINMFLDEARIAASISHPNVAQVFDLGKDENTYWIAMEYLHGEPLREIMRINEESEASIQPELAARVVADAAEGLHAAHELRGKDGRPLNLVHRDVTPHNLFITYDGVVKVVDFGIAKVTDSLSSTHAGTIKGKIAYMSPEQVRGLKIDRRADIFALGVVLWEMTTGQRLFRVDSDLATLSRVEACVVPPPSALHEDYPPELEAVLLTALQKEPQHRYQTAREFSRALQKFLMGSRVFVGPEEVSAYVKKLFGDRVRKREDHLRWAAEVTQTISIRRALTQEDSGDLLDLSNLPRGTGNTDSIDFDTIREQPAPKAHGVPSPLGATKAIARPHQVAPPIPAAGAPPMERKEPGREGSLSVTEAVAIPDDDLVSFDEEEDEAATLVATAPQVLSGAMAAMSKALAEDSPIVASHQPPSPYQPPPQPPVIVKTSELRPFRPEQITRPEGAQPPPARPVFDIHSSPAARTMQLPTVRRGASPLVVFAAAVGAGFIAAGLGAIWFVKSRSDGAVDSLPMHPSAATEVVSAAPSSDTPAALPSMDPSSTAEVLQPHKKAPESTAKPRQPDTKAPAADTKKNELLDSLPDLPPDPSELSGEVRPGFLSVRCSPACDRIVAGGQGFTSLARASFPPGQYRVQCIRGDVTKVISVIVVSDQHTLQNIKMD